MKEIDFKDVKLNPFTAFGKDWMLVTAGNEKDGFNTMTIGWGHLGAIWEREGLHNSIPTAVCYVRPSRYTKKFMDREEYFTLSHFTRDHRKALSYLGTHSGRDGDKVSEAGLTPVFADGTTYFAEADMVFVCRKLYAGVLKEENFADRDAMEYNYPLRDFHTMYIGEIVKVLTADGAEG